MSGEYSASDIRNKLKANLVVLQGGTHEVPSITAKQAAKNLRFNERTRVLLRERDPSGEDRSARLFELASLLLEHGASPDQTFVLCQASVWNKFAGRADESQRIWEAVTRAQDSEDNDRGRLQAVGPRGKSGLARPLAELLARDVHPAEWAVERIWEHRGWGFIAGEPKCFKSTFATDLAVSLATGTPFLGHFPIAKPGPVLVVQEENSEQIQWARFNRILRARELSGKLHSYSNGLAEITFPSLSPEVYCIDRKRFDLSSTRKREKLRSEISAVGPALVVLDPLQRMLGNYKINDSDSMNRCFDFLDGIIHDYRTSLLIVHHYRKMKDEGPQEGGQRMLGSQALHSWLSCGLYAQKNGTEGRIRISTEFRAFPDTAPFEVSFSDDDEFDRTDRYSVSVVEQATKTQKDLLKDLVSDRPGILIKDASETLGISERRVRDRAHAHPEIDLKPYKPKGHVGRPTSRLFLAKPQHRRKSSETRH